MKNIILDTCVLIHIIRQSDIGKRCIQAIRDFDDNANLIISVVSKGELESFAKQRNWGSDKSTKLNQIFTQVAHIDISNADQLLIDSYTQIDAYSKRKAPDKSGNILTGSARKMGKNDLWIAATAYSLDIPLMTTDSDFDHLNDVMLKLIRVV